MTRFAHRRRPNKNHRLLHQRPSQNKSENGGCRRISFYLIGGWILLVIIAVLWILVINIQVTVQIDNQSPLLMLFEEFAGKGGANSSSVLLRQKRPVKNSNEASSERNVIMSSSNSATKSSTTTTSTTTVSLNNNNDNNNKDRVYCMVPFIWTPESQKRHTEIMETWGRRCDVIRFMIDPIIQIGTGTSAVYQDVRTKQSSSSLSLPDNVVVINMTRPWHTCSNNKPCRHIWEKMWRSWVWVEKHELDTADWFVKVDWDTYFFPQNLKYFVQQKGWTPDEQHYFGHKLYHTTNRKTIKGIIVGATVIFSSATLQTAAQVYRDMPSELNAREDGRCIDRSQATEEVTTAVCLATKGVYAQDTLDPEGREHITVERITQVLTWNRTEQGEWWYWKNKPPTVGQLDECCAHRPIAFHGCKTDGALRYFELDFYGTYTDETRPKWGERTRPEYKRYVAKVRKAMMT